MQFLFLSNELVNDVSIDPINQQLVLIFEIPVRCRKKNAQPIFLFLVIQF